MTCWAYRVYYGGKVRGVRSSSFLRVFPGEKMGVVKILMLDAIKGTLDTAKLVKVRITELETRKAGKG